MNIQESFSILKINYNASLEDIKHAYKKRAFETHPDRGGNASEFVKVRAAYEILLKYVQNNSDEKPEDFDIPIPEELRTVIDGIVNGFCYIYNNNSNNIHAKFNLMRSEISSYINRSDLQTLGSSFCNYFQGTIYSTINSITDANNKQTQLLLQNYEKWFSSKFNELNNEIYAVAKFNYWKSTNFIISIVVSLLTIFASYYFFEQLLIGIIIGFIILISFYYYSINEKAKATQRIKPKDFSFNFNNVSSISTSIANHIRGFTTASQIAAWSGIRSNDLSTGIAGVLIGAAIQFIGELTAGGKKTKLLTEALKTTFEIEEDFSKYYSEEMQKFLNELQDNIKNNYKERNKKLILLLTEK